MKSNRKALAALVGAIAAALGVGYGTGALDPLLGKGADQPVVAKAEAPKTQAPAANAEAPAAEAAAKAEAPAAAPEKKESEVAAVATDGGAKSEPEVQAPAFDLLRVEPSGDVVIAGTAAPGSALEIVSGSDVLAKVQAGPSGDFAAVLNEPLKPGDYQIVLRATGTDGTVVNSTGTAIVSVPETDKGEVLALVEEPGKASRLISATGGTGADAAAQTEAPAASAEPAKPAEMAQAEKPAETAQASAGDSTETSAPPAAETAAPQEETVAKAEQPATAESTAPNAQEQGATAPVTEVAKPDVAIEAVEIEGDSVFVAGAAKPGETVRVYANDILLGDSKTSPQGRFLIEAKRDLPQGDYIIRADVIGADGAEVVARAAVPFQREAGEKVAAVAPAESAASEPAPVTGEAAASAPESEPADATAASGEPAGTAEPAEQAAAAAEPATEAAGEGTADVAANQPTAEPLKGVDHAVIIRRGDTLWRISKRVYGRGTRYTTIYKANQKQIRNPDMIFPGQTFMVPDKSENGETADMKKLRPQG